MRSEIDQIRGHWSCLIDIYDVRPEDSNWAGSQLTRKSLEIEFISTMAFGTVRVKARLVRHCEDPATELGGACSGWYAWELRMAKRATAMVARRSVDQVQCYRARRGLSSSRIVRLSVPWF